MLDRTELSKELSEYLGNSRRVWELADPYGRLRSATLYTATEVPKVKFAVLEKSVTPIRQLNEPSEADAAELIGYDLIANLDADPNCMGAFTWFPAFAEFGTWCANQQNILLYPGIDLKDVLLSPVDYIYAQGLPQGRVEPYAIPPRASQIIDEERFQALIVRARNLQKDPRRLPDALKLALLATDRQRSVDERHLKAADYVANQLLLALRDYDDIVPLCDNLLNSMQLAPQFAFALINEAARYECNSGNEAAAIARLEEAVSDSTYDLYHERFRKILNHIKNPPST